MKRNYTLKTMLFLALTFCITQLTAQVRILKLDPATNSVTLKNFGTTNATISGYWFCNIPAYAPLSGMTSVTTLAPNEELNVASNINFAVADGEFGLYTSNAFSSSSAMIDYMQWGSAGHGRESVAVAAGLWSAGTFISAAPPFEYTGDGTQNGVVFWSTLSTEDFQLGSTLKLYPNPTDEILNIEFQTVIASGTIEVFDLLGKQITTQSIVSNNKSEINVSDWETGLYLVKISSENGEETKRFVKQ